MHGIQYSNDSMGKNGKLEKKHIVKPCEMMKLFSSFGNISMWLD